MSRLGFTAEKEKEIFVRIDATMPSLAMHAEHISKNASLRFWNILAFLLLLIGAMPMQTARAEDQSVDAIFQGYTGAKPLAAEDKAAFKAGFEDLKRGFISEGEGASDAAGYAIETLSAFLNGKDDGGAEYIAKYAPNLTRYVIENMEYMSNIQALKDEADIAKSEAEIKKTEAEIDALKRLNKTLSGSSN